MLGVAVLGFYAAAMLLKRYPIPDLTTTLLYISFGFIGSHLVVKVSHGNHLTLGDPVTISALWCHGPSLALLTLIPATLVQIFTQKRAFLNSLFNSGQYSLTVAISGALVNLFSGTKGAEQPFGQILLLLFTVFTFDMANILFVSLASAIDQEQPIWSILKVTVYADRRNSLVLIYIINTTCALLAFYMGKTGMIFVFLGILSLLLQTRFQQELTQKDREAKTDPLTGLYNIRYMEDWLNKDLTQATNATQCSVIFIDIDGLKNVNDLLGHEVGDAVLRHLSHLLKMFTRESDHVIRYGGDEFVIICEKTDLEAAKKIAQRILHATVTNPLVYDGIQTSYGISLGVASCPEHGDLGQDLIRLGDKAMYTAKRHGGNTVCTASDL
jgi:diguanylate cyclase (GGDEF)-like protein